MGQLICFFSVAVLITLLHIFKLYLMEEKYDFFEILGYYLKATVIINFIVIISIFIINKFWVWNRELSNGFIIEYIIVGSVIGLFLPKLYYDIRRLKKNRK